LKEAATEQKRRQNEVKIEQEKAKAEADIVADK